MIGRLSTILWLAALFVATAVAVARADNYYDNPARAARNNDAEALRGMLAGEDAKPNETDEESRTALHYAASNGNVEIIAILIKVGAKLDPADRLGNTPLHLAADRRRTEAGELLLAAGARVDPQNHEGRTPLMVAASRGDTQLVLALLAKGASTTLNDYTGRDALAWAEEGRHPAVIAALQRAANDRGR
jgi:uncharacterized protein